MEVHATGDAPHAIVVDEDVLKRIWGHAEAFAGPPSATLSCVDGVERKFASIHDLIGYENPKRSEARTIEIYARDSKSSRSVSITIGTTWGRRASVSLRGEEQDVSAARTKILDSFAGMRPWYSPMATMDLWIFWMIALGALWLLATTMAPTRAPEHDGRSLKEALRVIASGLVVVLPAFVLVWLVGALRSSCFPMVSMAFGQGLRRYQVKDQVRWAVIVALVVGIAGSVIYGAFSGT